MENPNIFLAPGATSSKDKGQVSLKYLFVSKQASGDKLVVNRGIIHLTRKAPYVFEELEYLYCLTLFSTIFILADEETVPRWFLEVQEILKKRQTVVFLTDLFGDIDHVVEKRGSLIRRNNVSAIDEDTPLEELMATFESTDSDSGGRTQE